MASQDYEEFIAALNGFNKPNNLFLLLILQGCSMGFMLPARKIWSILVTILVFLLLPLPSSAWQWVNPREAVKDPNLARLQRERKGLTNLERQEIEKYGYTALEIMTYVDDNRDCGQDNDASYRRIQVDASGIMKSREMLIRKKYYYKDHLSLLTYNGIKPGEMEYRRIGHVLYPSDIKGSGFLEFNYFTSEKVSKESTTWLWSTSLRRLRRTAAAHKEDNVVGVEVTRDDDYMREPWEEEHRILGENIIRGHKCFVIESKNKKSDYYLSKRVTWIEKENFLDLHEEQFDEKGKFHKIFDKHWQQIKPWNCWVVKEWNVINLITGVRSVQHSYDWIFDQGLTDEDFTPKVLMREKPWRFSKTSLPPVKGISDLPPVPEIREEFWKKVGGR